jgi:hypothetical protein
LKLSHLHWHHGDAILEAWFLITWFCPHLSSAQYNYQPSWCSTEGCQHAGLKHTMRPEGFGLTCSRITEYHQYDRCQKVCQTISCLECACRSVTAIRCAP